MEYNWRTIKADLLIWYREHHRELAWRNTRNPYYIWLSEIMLQQTRVEAVKDYFNRFLAEVPDIETLSQLSEERLLKLWEGLGYYNRARNLKKAAIQIMEDYAGQFPVHYDEVLSLPGIGEYTAGAICSICYDLPTPAVDGNVLRVFMRLMNSDENIDQTGTKQRVKDSLLPLYSEGQCGELTQALMELGATVCIPKGAPKCKSCPLRTHCLAYREDTWRNLPVRSRKKKRRIEEKTVFILHDGSYYGVRKRKAGGLLSEMWEFFHTEGILPLEEAVEVVAKKGFEPVQVEKEVPYTHIFTHVEWRMKAYYISCHNRKDELLWVKRKDLEERYPLPSAFKIFIDKEQ